MDHDHAFAEENLPALALGALEEEESARVREHLQRCTRCRAEYLAFENVVAALAYSAPQVDPPSHLRHTLRALTAFTPVGSTRPFAHETRRPSLLRGLRMSRLSMFVLVLLAVGLLGWNVSLHQRMTVLAEETAYTREMGALVMDYMEHPDAYVYFTMVGRVASRAPRAMVIMARTDSRLLLIVEGLPVEAGAMYTVWLIDRQGRRVHARKVRCDEQGRIVLLLRSPIAIEDIWRIRVTPADADGTPLLEGELPANHGLPIFMASVAL